MKVLIAILSCHSHKGYEQAQRDTWLKDVSDMDYKFMLGRPLTLLDKDEVYVDVDDGIQSLTEKAVKTYAWALQEGYDFVYKADLDTLVRPKLLLISGFEKYDYTGGCNGGIPGLPFASGGSGYCLSRKAMQIVVSTPFEAGPAEDVHTAKSLQSAGISLNADSRYLFCPGAVMDDNTIAYHLSSVRAWNAKYDPSMMYEAYRDQKNKDYKSYRIIPQNVRRVKKLRRLR